MADFSVNRATVRRRLVLIFVMTIIITLLLISRLAWIQIVRADELYEQAWEQWNRMVPVQTSRGSIYDRHGNLLAGSASVDTIAAIPSQVEDPASISAVLAPVLEMDQTRIKEIVTMDKSSVYLKRRVPPDVSKTVREMNIPGIIFFPEEKRNYPGEHLASQLLGFVGMDKGLAGLEHYYEQSLKNAQGNILYPADGRGRQLPHHFSRFAPVPDNYNIKLSIDESIQHIVEKELDVIMEQAAPSQAMAVAVDPYSGAVLAAASRPDYHPDSYTSFDPERWSLPVFNSSFEPGSTFKMITLAAAIEEGLFKPEETVHCPGHITIGGRQINCWTASRGGHGEISFYDALGGSCNVAYIKLGKNIGKDILFHYVDGFGFGSPTGIDYPGESSGLVFHPHQVGSQELATTAFGQGISVTPIQQTMAITAMINGGYLFKPYLVEEIVDQDGEIYFKREPELIRQVVSEETSERLIEMMESVILEGTGANAALENYRVAGKTGTAEKIDEEGNYRTDEFIYSLVGFAPVEKPQLVLFVAVDGVTRGPRFGSQTSAPLFARIMEDTLNYLQVSPSEKPADEPLSEQ